MFVPFGHQSWAAAAAPPGGRNRQPQPGLLSLTDAADLVWLGLIYAQKKSRGAPASFYLFGSVPKAQFNA